MSRIETYDELITANDGRTFSREGARGLQKTLDSIPTGNHSHNWVDIETGANIYLSHA